MKHVHWYICLTDATQRGRYSSSCSIILIIQQHTTTAACSGVVIVFHITRAATTGGCYSIDSYFYFIILLTLLNCLPKLKSMHFLLATVISHFHLYSQQNTSSKERRTVTGSRETLLFLIGGRRHFSVAFYILIFDFTYHSSLLLFISIS